MNKYLKKILLGFIIWVIPFVTSFFVWDVAANEPTISIAWFNSLMVFTWSIGFAIAAFLYFKDIKVNKFSEGWKTGLIWYIELLLLDLLFLVGLFGMSLGDYYPMLLTYLNVIVISSAIGYIKK
ncbi:hypothetical protein HN385_00665 [archaeon]|jgi:hypothetical protein|nr:hypothetical protein [archaeon]MBT3450939.1 hypothetical protein [archaeon]MBT6869585.1 hypothetical protein [archaeon]MBT7193423.1 hypothetical protein [archaeon]MBT7381014.1 hypothetical protein [archaeon]